MKTLTFLGFFIGLIALIIVIREAIIMQDFRKHQGYKKSNQPLTAVGQPQYDTIEEFWAGQGSSAN